MNLMLSKTTNDYSPMWLALACNELRLFGINSNVNRTVCFANLFTCFLKKKGEFTTVTKKIQQLPADYDGLVKEIIKRLNSDYNDNVIKEVLSIFLFNFQNSIQKI